MSIFQHNFFLAMDRAQTSEVESSIEIIIVAIVSGLVIVIVISVVIYVGCFKTKTFVSVLNLQLHKSQNDDQISKQKQKNKGWFSDLAKSPK